MQLGNFTLQLQDWVAYSVKFNFCFLSYRQSVHVKKKHIVIYYVQKFIHIFVIIKSLLIFPLWSVCQPEGWIPLWQPWLLHFFQQQVSSLILSQLIIKCHILCTLHLTKCNHDNGDLHCAFFSIIAPNLAAIKCHWSIAGSFENNCAFYWQLILFVSCLPYVYFQMVTNPVNYEFHTFMGW